jgi:heme/copper-type cytochrome/quinol oxidase subunit 2
MNKKALLVLLGVCVIVLVTLVMYSNDVMLSPNETLLNENIASAEGAKDSMVKLVLGVGIIGMVFVIVMVLYALWRGTR